jgi:hypothetical protein
MVRQAKGKFERPMNEARERKVRERKRERERERGEALSP